eukprot:GDKI01003513.1.p1 GENE.GDKI01003513.1~~GDKI01003513.1.p1  ORF type:complete len:235 (+),score=71.77 GDKI01003513.1:104-706(+)
MGDVVSASPGDSVSHQETETEFPIRGLKYCIVTPICVSRGDHVYREIGNVGLSAYASHHGIYCGNGRVIHFSGNEGRGVGGLSAGLSKGAASDARIKSISIVDFMRFGSKLSVVTHRNADPPEVTIQRAEESFADQDYPEYHLLQNNCEHFATWCKTGSKKSSQVSTLLSAAAAGAVGAAALGGAGAAALALMVLSRRRE